MEAVYCNRWCREGWKLYIVTVGAERMDAVYCNRRHGGQDNILTIRPPVTVYSIHPFLLPTTLGTYLSIPDHHPDTLVLFNMIRLFLGCKKLSKCYVFFF
jgi:hypothetical protein